MMAEEYDGEGTGKHEACDFLSEGRCWIPNVGKGSGVYNRQVYVDFGCFGFGLGTQIISQLSEKRRNTIL
jgi:hypothetical protein